MAHQKPNSDTKMKSRIIIPEGTNWIDSSRPNVWNYSLKVEGITCENTNLATSEATYYFGHPFNRGGDYALDFFWRFGKGMTQEFSEERVSQINISIISCLGPKGKHPIFYIYNHEVWENIADIKKRTGIDAFDEFVGSFESLKKARGLPADKENLLENILRQVEETYKRDRKEIIYPPTTERFGSKLVFEP